MYYNYWKNFKIIDQNQIIFKYYNKLHCGKIKLNNNRPFSSIINKAINNKNDLKNNSKVNIVTHLNPFENNCLPVTIEEFDILMENIGFNFGKKFLVAVSGSLFKIFFI